MRSVPMRPLKSERAQFLYDNLDLPEAAQFEAARWEHFQIVHFEDDSTFRIEDKSRQIAWSWTAAAEAVAEGIFNRRGQYFRLHQPRRGDGENPLRQKTCGTAYARTCDRRLITDNKLELEFDTGATPYLAAVEAATR